MEKGGGSRLLQMQARFQQKQLQERELKIASLYEAQQARALDKVRMSPSNASTTSSTAQPPVHQPGKVRQMFEERRTKAGIDKSYPLQPIHNTDRAKARNSLPNGFPKVANSRVTGEKKAASRTQISTHSVKKQVIEKSENIVNISGDLNHNHEFDLNSAKNTNEFNGLHHRSDEVDNFEKGDSNGLLEDETFPEALAPTPTPRSPEPKREIKKIPPQKQPIQRRPSSPTKPRTHIAPVTARKATSENTVPENSNKRTMQRPPNSVMKKTPMTPPSKSRSVPSTTAASAATDGAACAICGRRFAPDRLAKHQEICKRSHSKKRKPFDALKHRLAGTEAEPFIGKLRKSPPQSSKGKQLNSTWRQKHEEFIQAIRAAKQVQAHLKAGGKLSDLPPPPPSENPDYVQCPHCNRRFNQAAAERHIPKCANYQFNKPKPSKRR